MTNIKSVNTLLIAGTGRSGTNILKKVLSLNSEVFALPFEHRFFIDPDGILDFYTNMLHHWSPFLFDKKIKQLKKYLLSLAKQKTTKKCFGKILRFLEPSGLIITNHSYYGWEMGKWFPNYITFVNNLIDDLIDFSYNGRWPGSQSYKYRNQIDFHGHFEEKDLIDIFSKNINCLLSQVLEANKKTCFVEDNTWNILFADNLLKIMQESKILHIYRDPRDVVASMMKQNWCPSELIKTINYYKAIINYWFIQRNKIPAEKLLEIKFEAFINNPEKYTRDICNFISLDFEDKMLAIDLDKHNITRYKTDFSESQLELINSNLYTELKSLNYE